MEDLFGDLRRFYSVVCGGFVRLFVEIGCRAAGKVLRTGKALRACKVLSTSNCGYKKTTKTTLLFMNNSRRIYGNSC